MTGKLLTNVFPVQIYKDEICRCETEDEEGKNDAEDDADLGAGGDAHEYDAKCKGGWMISVSLWDFEGGRELMGEFRLVMV